MLVRAEPWHWWTSDVKLLRAGHSFSLLLGLSENRDILLMPTVGKFTSHNDYISHMAGCTS